MTDFLEWGELAFSFYQFPWCKYLCHGQLQATTMMSLVSGLGRDGHYQLWQVVKADSSIPLAVGGTKRQSPQVRAIPNHSRWK